MDTNPNDKQQCGREDNAVCASHNDELAGMRDVFASVDTTGYPKGVVKEQPWRKLWNLSQDYVTESGQLFVAISTRYDYGSASLGGY
jgi:hypothetical protein